MSDPDESSVPAHLQASSADVDYDLNHALRSVVSLRARIPEDAFTAPILGTERGGHGVAIRDSGLVLTIGYLITEADEVWLFDGAGGVVAGDVVAYDYETGLGLVQALGHLAAPAMPLGSAAELDPGDTVVMAGFGGISQAMLAQVTAIEEFAGYWEYVLDEAIFTTPSLPNWGGAALISPAGRLCGIGSLHVEQSLPGAGTGAGNMSVPVDLLLPILDELLMHGRTLKPARPWLGLFATELDGRITVMDVYSSGPAAEAGLLSGDVVTHVGGVPVEGLGDFFRGIWTCGSAGTAIPLRLIRDREVKELAVPSVDRRDYWRAPQLH